MPKSTKHKKAKAADFTKAKLKLGKGKQAPTNAVDTSFTSRSIVVPSQRITQQTDLPTTRRKLTFEDLLSHLRHYNAATRKDAIFGLRELFELYPNLLDTCLAQLINATIRLIPDEDPAVRKTLIVFYTWLLPRIPLENLEPRVQLLLLFITSAQNHIFPEIRVDAVRFLDIFLEYIPNHITSGWDDPIAGHGTTKVLKGYLGLLNVASKFSQDNESSYISVVLTPASKLVILQSLVRFLKHALGYHDKKKSSWYMASSFPDSTVLKNLERKLNASGPDERVRLWRSDSESVEDYVCHDPSPTYSISNLNDLTLSPDGESDSTVSQLLRALQSTMRSTFLDHAPSVFDPVGYSAETELHLVLAITELAVVLYGTILRVPQNTSDIQRRTIDDLKSLLGYMSAYFPAVPASGSDIKIEAAFWSWNSMYCELTALLMKFVPVDLEIPWSTNISNYVLDLLQSASSPIRLTRHLTADSYASLLPTLWLLITSSEQWSHQAFQTTIDHGINLSSKSPIKQLTIEFIARIILLSTEPQYRGVFQAGRNMDDEEKIQEWIVHLPKTLWEVGTTSVSTSETIIRVILHLLQRSPKYFRLQTITSVSSRLVPYFSIQHPERGHIPGPFAQMPPYLKRLVLNLTGMIQSTCSQPGLEAAIARVT